MCWVMPPASPAATSVSRMASSRLVLPWSTWPMTVMTGGPRLEVLGIVDGLLLELGLFVGGVHDLDLAAEVVGEDLDGLVAERLGDGDHLAVAHERLDDLGRGDAEELGDVLDGGAGRDLDDALSGRPATGCCSSRSPTAAAAAAPVAAALWPPPRREAPASMTTRRRLPPGRRRAGARRRPRAPRTPSRWPLRRR